MVLHNPRWIRVFRLDSPEKAVAELEEFLATDNIPLIILGELAEGDTFIQLANFVCLQPTAHPRQCVLWIKEAEVLAKVENKLKALVQQFSAEEVYEKVQAFTVLPEKGSLAAVIHKGNFNFTTMELAYGKALLNMSGSTPSPLS